MPRHGETWKATFINVSCGCVVERLLRWDGLPPRRGGNLVMRVIEVERRWQKDLWCSLEHRELFDFVPGTEACFRAGAMTPETDFKPSEEAQHG